MTLPTARPPDARPLVYDTRIEAELMHAWQDFEPWPVVLSATDPAGNGPALIDFTILDLRIGLQVWTTRVVGFVSHRNESGDGFGGFEFHEVAQLPLNRDLTLAEFVELVWARYDEILQNLPAVAQHPSARMPQWQLFASVALFAVLVPVAIVGLFALVAALPYLLDPGAIHRALFGD